MTHPRLAHARRSALWSVDHTPGEASPLSGRQSADVVIVGAGFSGLWTAYWLTEFIPGKRIRIIEAERIGHGASGRNGGWLSALLPVSLTDLAATLGEERTVSLQRVMFESVSEVEEICQFHGIDAHISHQGSISLIRNSAHEARARADVDDYQRFGFASHIEMWDRSRTMTKVKGDHLGTYRPDCAVLHPRRLVEGLAELIGDRGVNIHEESRVRAIEPGRIETTRGSVNAPIVVDCREAYGARLSGRVVVPIHSSMIATEPLSPAVWDEIGLPHREALSDYRRQIIYAQRTHDDRLAFGGRGVGYAFGSRIRDRSDYDDRVHSQLLASMGELFPVLSDVQITHRWGGPLAVPRDWTWSVTFDRGSGLGRLGGYVGDGVTSTFVAGRAMARLIVDGNDDLPLIGHRSRRWEPEPLRWIGVNTMNRLSESVDKQEARGRVGGLMSRLVDVLIG